MRLIDAEELKSRTTDYDEEGCRIWHEWDIDNTPTVERPHGEWIPYKTDFLIWNVCNQCRASVGTLGMNFCPNCGADMRVNSNADK